MTAGDLAVKIVKYIMANPGVTYDQLQARAMGKFIEMNTFEQAMDAIHRFKKIERKSNTAGDIIYSENKPKPVNNSFFERMAEWNKNNPYPVMDETNDAHHEIFEGVDMSYLFMKPDDAKEWWAKKKFRPWELARK